MPFDLYGPQELAEMEAAGVGECVPRPAPLHADPVSFPGHSCPVFAESLARVYEAKGYSRAAANVREIAKL